MNRYLLAIGMLIGYASGMFTGCASGMVPTGATSGSGGGAAGSGGGVMGATGAGTGGADAGEDASHDAPSQDASEPCHVAIPECVPGDHFCVGAPGEHVVGECCKGATVGDSGTVAFWIIAQLCD